MAYYLRIENIGRMSYFYSKGSSSGSRIPSMPVPSYSRDLSCQHTKLESQQQMSSIGQTFEPWPLRLALQPELRSLVSSNSFAICNINTSRHGKPFLHSANNYLIWKRNPALVNMDRSETTPCQWVAGKSWTNY